MVHRTGGLDPVNSNSDETETAIHSKYTKRHAGAHRLFEKDPYWVEGIWADYELYEWVQAF
jgi:uncharacterized protein YciI